MEQDQLPYYQAARFSTKQQAGDAYGKAQAVLWRAVDSNLSAYRFLRNGTEWHVLVIGERPGERVHLELEAIFTTGTLVTLPSEVLLSFLARRRSQTRLGPWVEGHYGQQDETSHG